MNGAKYIAQFQTRKIFGSAPKLICVIQQFPKNMPLNIGSQKT